MYQQPYLANFLKTFREKNALSRWELANAAGLSQASIVNWENGRSTPDRRNARKLKSFVDNHIPMDLRIKRMEKKLNELYAFVKEIRDALPRGDEEGGELCGELQEPRDDVPQRDCQDI